MTKRQVESERSGEHARARRWFRRLAETICWAKFTKAGRFRPRPRRACFPTVVPPDALITCITIAAASVLIAQTTTAPAPTPPALRPQTEPATGHKSAIDRLIPWLLDEGAELRGVPFSEVIFDTTGKQVLAVDPKNEIDARVIRQISVAMGETVRRLNNPDNAVQAAARINEVSSHVEDTLRELLNVSPGLTCDLPHTANGKVQRSGYPDLQVVDTTSKRVFYLDPKLYAAGSRDSSFRTFYFEPKVATNKVRADAVHLIAGFEHQPRNNGRWNFTRWDLVDLSRLRVKLKAEFQGSNRDMYRPEAIVASSADKP